MKFKDSPSSSPTFRITGKHELFFLIFVFCLHFVDLFLTPVVCWWFTVVDPSPEYVVCSCIRRYRRFGVVLNLMSLFACFSDSVCTFICMFCALAPPLTGVAPMNIHRIQEFSGKHEEHQER
jgi:hypothetical protein